MFYSPSLRLLMMVFVRNLAHAPVLSELAAVDTILVRHSENSTGLILCLAMIYPLSG